MNILIFAHGILSYFHLNNYFGWNVIPASDTELIGDLLVMIIFCLSFRR